MCKECDNNGHPTGVWSERLDSLGIPVLRLYCTCQLGKDRADTDKLEALLTETPIPLTNRAPIEQCPFCTDGEWKNNNSMSNTLRSGRTTFCSCTRGKIEYEIACIHNPSQIKNYDRIT